MLQLKNITKEYAAGTLKVEALRGVNLTFRDNEFVSILGPSGCGKTTMLNLLGGLDRYTTGDLVINGKSTTDFSDRDWDTYRNRRVGFVFQSYNLIPHQTVLSNVELAMTLSGVSRSERRQRAADVLKQVGLGDQLHKRPNQMSGGQMQRVAIARALVNNPDILMADEPTGALDSETSVQIMEILKVVAKDRLVIMVTHNGDLAEKYSTRIIRLLDGRVMGDTNPFDGQDVPQPAKKEKRQKTSMSFGTALSLSLNNLMTKKTRTFMTAFAGSIGIIGIALILALSSGFQGYINRIQQDTLSTYPLSIEQSTTDITSMLSSLQSLQTREEHSLDRIYSNDIMNKMVETMAKQTESNDLEAFKKYLEANSGTIKALTNDIKYSYPLDMYIYSSGTEEPEQINPVTFMGPAGSSESSDMSGMSMMSGGMMSGGSETWSEMLDNQELLEAQYDVLAGRWPESSSYDEVVLIVDENNELTDYALYALGLKDPKDISDMRHAFLGGEEYVPGGQTILTYDEALKLTFELLPVTAYYKQAGEGWLDMRTDNAFVSEALKTQAITLKVVGILRPAEGVDMASINSTVGYTKGLTQHLIDTVNASDIVKEQRANPETDVFTGKPFATEDEPAEQVDLSSLTEEQQAYLASLSEEERAAMLASFSTSSKATLEENLNKLNAVSEDVPSGISLYPVDFASKESIVDFIDDYNKAKTEAGEDEHVIHYTDLIGLLMSSVSSIINAISYVLIAFVGISLVVSSIMIGIITYVSVLERTKEIGILKSIGASRSDISRVFNAETLIVGFVAGLLGIVVTMLLCIPANIIIRSLTGISGVAALPWIGGAILVALSMLLTLVAGLIPSRVAARKDPVEALRME